MKVWVSISLMLAASALAVPPKSSTLLHPSVPGPAPAYSIGGPGSLTNFSKAAGRLFEIDGKKQYFAGSNAWWLGYLSKNSDVDLALSQIKKTGYKILRVWGFSDVNTPPPSTNTDANRVYFQLLNSSGSYINYGPDGIPRLDYVVHAAEKYNVKLVLPFVNNWGDFGGMDNVYAKAFGNNDTTWYSNSQAQKAYKDYIKVVVNRYKKSPAIFSWELGNEPRCQGCNTSVVYNWATEISQYIKKLDPNHMVTLGDEGWLSTGTFAGDGSSAYSGSNGVDFVKNLEIKTLDYGTFHLYPHSWGYNYTWGSTWITQHDVIGQNSGKPVILEEYGTPFPGNHTGTEGPWQKTVLDSGLAADQIWQFGTYDMTVPANSIKDENTIFYNETEYKTLGTDHAAAMAAKLVHTVY